MGSKATILISLPNLNPACQLKIRTWTSEDRVAGDRSEIISMQVVDMDEITQEQ